MSKVVKGVKRGFKRVGNFVKKHWKPIAMVGLAAFGAGIMIGGWSNFTAMASQGSGFWGTLGSGLKATGSVMKAGATGTFGTIGIGGGASGTYASAAGMQGATLMTGTAAQSMGLASQTMGPAANAASSAVGTYTGPGSSFMGGGGSLFGGGSTVGTAQTTPYLNAAGGNTSRALAQGAAEGAAQGAGGQVMTAGAPAAGGSLMRDMAVAATPALIQGVGAGLAAKAEEEAAKPRALWGYDIEGGTGYEGVRTGDRYSNPQYATQPNNVKQTVTGPDGKEYEPDGRGGWRPAGITFGLQPVGLMDMAGGRG